MKGFIKDFKRFFSLLGDHRFKFLSIVIVTGMGWAGSVILNSYAIKVIIEFFLYNESSYLVQAVIVVIARLLLDGVLNPLLTVSHQKRSEMVYRDIRKQVFRHMQRLPVGYLKNRHSGDVIVRVNTDIEALKEAMFSTNLFLSIMISLIMVIPYYSILDVRLLTIAIAMGVSFLVVTLKILEPMRKTFKKMHEHISSVSKTVAESISGFQIVRMFGLEDLFRDRVAGNLSELYEDQKKYSRLTGWNYGIGIFIWKAGSTIIASLGAWFAMNQTLDIGNLVASVSVTVALIFQIIDLGKMPLRMQKSFVGTDRLYELLDESPEPVSYSSIKGTETEAAIGFKDVEFSYEKSLKVLNGLSFDVPVGKTIAFVGDSGGGKSTAVKLILGLYSPDSGLITIQNRGLGEYTLDELRDQLAYVPQNAYIFNGTIYENIYYGNPDATEDEIIEAAKKANAHDFIMSKKDAYETIVGERGIKLSGGERQRIAIARAIVKNAPLLIFDEATSSLDKESELKVQLAMDNLLENRSSIVIAHRLSTIKKADCIYFIKDGAVSEHGTHDELIALEGLYHELYYKTFCKASIIVKQYRHYKEKETGALD